MRITVVGGNLMPNARIALFGRKHAVRCSEFLVSGLGSLALKSPTARFNTHHSWDENS